MAGAQPTPARASRTVTGEATVFSAVSLGGGPAAFVRGVSVLRDWPRRAAVVVGRAPHPQVLAALQEAGFTPVITPVEEADDTVARMAPFGFLIVGPDVLDRDDRIAAVRSWRRCSPSARLKLVYPHSEHNADVLLRAIRAGVNDVLDPEDIDGVRAELRAAIIRAGVSRERVLAIGAHPDDVEIGVAGTLLDHRRRGDRLTILTLSRGAVGGDHDDRVAEACATADRLGAQLLFADLPDTRIDPGIETIRLIEDVVRVLDPTVVYVHSIHDNHQDHRAVSEAARSATRGVRRVFAYQSPSATNDFRPTQFVRIDQTLSAKIELLQLFASQDGRNYLEPELVAAGARYWARHLATNARYAEPFEVVRSVGELRLLTESPTFEVEFAAASAQVRTLAPVLASEAS